MLYEDANEFNKVWSRMNKTGDVCTIRSDLENVPFLHCKNDEEDMPGIISVKKAIHMLKNFGPVKCHLGELQLGETHSLFSPLGYFMESTGAFLTNGTDLHVTSLGRPKMSVEYDQIRSKFPMIVSTAGFEELKNTILNYVGTESGKICDSREAHRRNEKQFSSNFTSPSIFMRNEESASRPNACSNVTKSPGSCLGSAICPVDKSGTNMSPTKTINESRYFIGRKDSPLGRRKLDSISTKKYLIKVATDYQFENDLSFRQNLFRMEDMLQLGAPLVILLNRLYDTCPRYVERVLPDRRNSKYETFSGRQDVVKMVNVALYGAKAIRMKVLNETTKNKNEPFVEFLQTITEEYADINELPFWRITGQEQGTYPDFDHPPGQIDDLHMVLLENLLIRNMPEDIRTKARDLSLIRDNTNVYKTLDYNDLLYLARLADAWTQMPTEVETNAQLNNHDKISKYELEEQPVFLDNLLCHLSEDKRQKNQRVSALTDKGRQTKDEHASLSKTFEKLKLVNEVSGVLENEDSKS